LPALPVAPAAGPVLVLAGSLSPITALQVREARSYIRIALDAVHLPSPAYRAQMAQEAANLLRAGSSVLACTSSAEGLATHGVPAGSRALAEACGAWLSEVLAAAPLGRIGIAGGDTSSLAVQALDAWGLSYLQAVAPGLALCRLHSDMPALDGMEIVLKGGQMGPPDLFERLLHGAA
ncbi:MAG: type effector Hrp-dependent outer domain protein, partial [Rhodoferax sp.]|nr:type effector Hrp-dependent outer domain protein [Rhodoferax sp.]